MSKSSPHEPFPPGRFWTAVGEWLDSVGVTQPAAADPTTDSAAHLGEPGWSAVEHVCPQCPICQGAALFDRVDWQSLTDLALATANLLSGVAGALLDPDRPSPAGPNTGEAETPDL